MADQGLSEAEAFRWIQRTAMNQRTSMKALAQNLLAAHDAGAGQAAQGPAGD
jgi:AmiR/NasT family two-component response regulator